MESPEERKQRAIPGDGLLTHPDASGSTEAHVGKSDEMVMVNDDIEDVQPDVVMSDALAVSSRANKHQTTDNDCKKAEGTFTDDFGQAGLFQVRSVETYDDEAPSEKAPLDSGGDNKQDEDLLKGSDFPMKPGDEEALGEQSLKIHEVGEGDEEQWLTEDAYSLLFTANLWSKTVFFAGFVVFLQAGFLLLTLLDLFDTSKTPNETNDATNRMSIPAGASLYVTLSQLLGMLLTAMVMAADGDFVIGITQLLKGYDPSILEKSPNATWARWLISALLQTLSGALLLLDSFILSMQSDAVIDLTLNLTALHFIQEIDEQFFHIAKDGLVSEAIQEDCEHVMNLKHNTTPEWRRRFVILKRILIVMMTIALLVPYFIVVSWQTNGRFLCKNLYIQFGDAYYPEMAFYSGQFIYQGNRLLSGQRKDQRAYYVDATNTWQVAYCGAEGAWTISYLNGDQCDYRFKSPDTGTFDVMDVANQGWVVSTQNAQDVNVDWLKILCMDCETDGRCSSHGTCNEITSKCECDSNRFGLNCEFEEPCEYFQLDQRTRDGLASIPGTSAFLETHYYSVGPKLYDRHVYFPWTAWSTYETMNNNSDVSNIDSDELWATSFIMFTGRRWVLYAIPDENLATIVNAHNRTGNWTIFSMVDYFWDYESYNHSFYGLTNMTAESINYFPTFFSSPMDYGEDSDSADPSSVTWMLTQPYNSTTQPFNDTIIPRSPDSEQPVAAKLLCSDCRKEAGECQNGGICDQGWCVCPQLYDGPLCERVKDCVDAGGCNDAGTCDKATRTCACDAGAFGSLCQLGINALEDEFLCTKCWWWGSGYCLDYEDNAFSQDCTCYSESWGGKYCDEWLGDSGKMPNNNTLL